MYNVGILYKIYVLTK